MQRKYNDEKPNRLLKRKMGNAFHSTVTEDIALFLYYCTYYIEIWLLDFTLYPLDVVSDDIRSKLIAKGIPAEEIAYIHDAKTEQQKSDLFDKVRNGEIRVLLGSTAKMGTGTNVQKRLIAVHDLDIPWRPADLEQRAGRIIRQGNENKNVQIFRYVTKGTFDAYSYQTLENKQKFISQIMTSKTPARKGEYT